MARSGPFPVEPRQTVTESVYQALKRDLITLRRRPGASLTEAELATAYGSSRVPVREACRRLQQEGLLTAIPFKGYFVSHISAKEISDCFDLRETLETSAVRRAVELATPGEIEDIEALAEVEYTYHDWDSYAEFLERNREFHVCLVALGGNDRLVWVLDDLLGTMQRFFFLGLDLGDFGTQMRHEHECLVTALRSRCADEAVACVRDQIAASRRRIQRALARDGIPLPLDLDGAVS
jgi:DNA-binding GntR family transcriptional regulator